jgi:glycosyltransferase involved in cell wall biosynthesis
MKVLIGITQSNFGGAQRHVFDLATNLADVFDIAVVHGGNGLLAERLRGKGVRTIPLGSLSRSVRLLSDAATLFALVRILRRERPDVFHVHSSKMGLLGAFAGRITGIPTIFTAHGWAFNENRGTLAKYAIYLLARLTVLLSREAIAVSEAVANDMPGIRMHVIRNGIAPEAALARDKARKELCARGTPSDGFWVVSVAELHPIKGLDVGLEGFAEFATTHGDAQYFLIGDGPELDHLRGRIEAFGLTGRVHCVGFLDARPLLAAFDAFLLPSLSEGLSYAILEAGLARLPVVASRVGGIPEIIDDGGHGILVPPRDAHAIARALARIADDASAASLGEALEKRVRERFPLERMVQQTAVLYASSNSG